MSDTYAVVNKPKQPHQPVSSPAHPASTPKTSSRTPPIGHHYDNDCGASGMPVYSVVRPRGKPSVRPHSAMAFCDVAAPANQKLEEDSDYQPMSAQQECDYEEFSSSQVRDSCSPAGIGFNNRVDRPKGPRDPPAEWNRMER